MKHLRLPVTLLQLLFTVLFGVAVFLFFGLAYPHHLHYQEQYQLFLFDSTYVWEIVRLPGGVADLLGRFCTQFFLFAWVGALIISLLLSAVQLLTLRLASAFTDKAAEPGALASKAAGSGWGWLYGLSFMPSFLLWLFLLDENALLGGVWAVLLTQLAAWLVALFPKGWTRRIAMLVAIAVLYWIALGGSHYHRYPTVFPVLLYAAWLSAIVLPLVVLACQRWINTSHLSPPFLISIPHFSFPFLISHFSFLILLFSLVWTNANFKAEKVMKYDFMARYQQWNRILETINAEKPNNQIGVTVQNLALAMRGMLADRLFDYHQNGTAGLLPDVERDATSPLPTAEAFYQLGMITVAQRTVFEAQEAILDFQKSARCYKRLAETNLILGSYEVARKYLLALQKTLFYRKWANETMPLLGNEKAITEHPEYGRLRQWAYNNNFYFSDHVTPEMLESLYFGRSSSDSLQSKNTDNHLALEYLKAYYMLTGDRESYTKLLLHLQKP